MDADRLLLVSKMKISSILAKYIGIFFSLLKPKVVYLCLFYNLFYEFPNFEN